LRFLESASATSYVNVLVSEAKQMIESNPGLVILDVRSQAEYDSGHLANATLIPVNELESKLYKLDKQKDILVYCGSGGRSATASQTLVDNGFSSVYNMLGGTTSWKNAGYWIEIVHVGDLIISGTQTYTIENCTFIQTGNIRVEDQAKLIIKNAELHMNLSYVYQYGMRCYNTASLSISNSTLTADNGLDIWLREQSYAVVNNTVVTFYARFFAEGRFTAKNLTAYNGFVDARPGSSVSVSDSSLHLVEAEFSNASFSGESLKARGPNIEYFNTFTNLTIYHGSCGNLTINDSKMEMGIQLSLNAESIAEISESILGYALLENSTMTIVDSQVNMLIPYGSTLFVENTRIAEILAIPTFSYGFSAFCLSNSTIAECYLMDSQLYFYGNFSFTPLWQIIEWRNVNATRNFNAIVSNGTEPLMDTELTLHTQDDTVVWSGVADSLGKTDFNVTFAENNYTDTLKLEAVKGSLSAETNISFFSDTPINLTLHASLTGDVNSDGIVDMKDISYVARRFMCIPDDILWDSAADINPDGKIDMRDISIVARHFGERYP